MKKLITSYVSLSSVLCLAALFGVWQLSASAHWVSPLFLPGPDRSFAALFQGMVSGNLRQDFVATIIRMFEAWAIASFIGIVVGATIGSFEGLRPYLEPSLEFLRPLPASAIVPFAIAAFGLTNQMILFVIAFGSLWPAMLATVHGFANVEPRLREVARLLRLSRWAVLTKIILPSAMPDIFAGTKLGLTVALILTIVGEMLSGQHGLGQRILLAARTFRAADLYACVILLGGIGFVSTVAFDLVETRCTRR